MLTQVSNNKGFRYQVEGTSREYISELKDMIEGLDREMCFRDPIRSHVPSLTLEKGLLSGTILAIFHLFLVALGGVHKTVSPFQTLEILALLPIAYQLTHKN